MELHACKAGVTAVTWSNFATLPLDLHWYNREKRHPNGTLTSSFMLLAEGQRLRIQALLLPCCPPVKDHNTIPWLPFRDGAFACCTYQKLHMNAKKAKLPMNSKSSLAPNFHTTKNTKKATTSPKAEFKGDSL